MFYGGINMSNTLVDDEKKPFQLRAFPVETRKLAVVCATKAGLTVPEWIDRAVHSQARLDRAESVFPPERPNSDGDAQTDLSAICELVRVAVDVAKVTGKPLRSDLQGRLLGLVDQEIRAARGMPQIPYRPMPPLRRVLGAVVCTDGEPINESETPEKCHACHRPFRQLDGLHYIIEKSANLLVGGHTSEAMKVLLDACREDRLQP